MQAKRKDNKGRVLRTGESQRADLTYMYRYTDKWQQRQCVYAPTLQELRVKEQQIAAAELNDKKAFSNIKLDELMERYCQLASNKRKTTRNSYESNRRTVQRYPIANKPVRKIKMSEAKLWLMELYDSGYAVSTVGIIGRYLRRVCQLAVDDDLIAKNPFNFSFDFLPTGNKRDALTEDEQQKFLDFIRNDWSISIYLDSIVVLLGTGLRLGEFLGLTNNDVDLKNKQISINHQLKGASPSKLYIEQPKSQSGNRVIPMTDEVYRAINRMAQRANRVKCPVMVDGYTGFIALGKNDKLMTEHSFDAVMARMRNKYNETHEDKIYVTPHILRHTFCTNMYKKGLSAASLQYLMGHAQMTTTLDIYTHNTYDGVEQEFRRVISA